MNTEIVEKKAVELESRTGMLQDELKEILFLFDSVRQKYFVHDPDQVSEMTEKMKAYAFSSSYEPLFFCLRHLSDALEGALQSCEIIRDLVSGEEDEVTVKKASEALQTASALPLEIKKSFIRKLKDQVDKEENHDQ